MVKKSRSNVSQAPENLPSRRESAKNGILNPDAPLTEMQRRFVVHLVDYRHDADGCGARCWGRTARYRSP